jgi:hypothetical protein
MNAPVEITAERFDEALNFQPPKNHRGDHGCQSFMMFEFSLDDSTSIFCEIGGRYFEFSDSCDLSHREIVARCALLTWPTSGVVAS